MRCRSATFDKLVSIDQDQKVSMLIVEQKVNDILCIAHRVYCIKLGKVVYDGEAGGDKKRLGGVLLIPLVYCGLDRVDCVHNYGKNN